MIWALPLVVLSRLSAMATPIPPVGPDWVIDEAGLLSQGDRSEAAAVISQEKERSGTQLAVLTLPTSNEDPKALAVRALNEWDPGPNSALLLVVMQPHQLFIQPGTSLSGTFDQANASRICRDEIAPLMRAGQGALAVRRGLQAMSEALHDPHPVTAPAHAHVLSKGAVLGVVFGVPLFILGVMVFMAVVIAKAIIRQRKACRACGKPVRVQRNVLRRATRAMAGSGRADYACGACGESWSEMYSIEALSWYSSDNDSDSGWSGSNDSGGGGSTDGSGGGGSSW